MTIAARQSVKASAGGDASRHPALAQYLPSGSRGERSYADLRTPDFAMLAASFGLPHVRVAAVEEFERSFDRAIAAAGPQLIEIDMAAIGPYAEPFGGPPAGAAGR